MKALILAAGYATRLYPLTLNQPKPLLELGGRPIIEYIVEKLAKLDKVDEVYVVTNHRFYENFTSWEKGFKCSKKIYIFDDKTTSNEDRLGAIGDIDAAIKQFSIDDELFVIAGDNWFEESLHGIIEKFTESPAAVQVGLYDLGSLKEAHRYGVCRVNDRQEVVEFQEKPEKPKSSLISMGMYIYPREKLELINQYMASSAKKDAPGNLIAWLVENDRVVGYVFKKRWFDIGNIDSYHAADKYVSEKTRINTNRNTN